jgi:hypothetical protein
MLDADSTWRGRIPAVLRDEGAGEWHRRFIAAGAGQLTRPARNERIVGIDLIADPERLRELDLTTPLD